MIRRHIFLLLLTGLYSTWLGANTPSEDLTTYILQAGSLPAAQEAARRTVGELPKRCAVCHGEEGHSTQPTRPNLAGQQPLYLVLQIQHFTDQSRTNPLMHEVAMHLNREEAVRLALYYSAKSPKPTGRSTDDTQQARGKFLYQARCGHCHGDNAQGQGIYARLAGQQFDYLREALLRFQRGDEKRKHVGMTAITKDLAAGDIEALAAYLTNHP